ncbi:MAG: thiamine phosphate synthase [Paludibacteraceae bacterium]|nr:thiamine phosphate synthase [Paludibacteraceae bacterium]MBQ4033556.1 thiamine phosphate synthase [Paludibacteraceae bacterium]MBQ5524525.1 thiamine phosphate synthase [Paludibacteraceae bacterium]
MLQFISHYTEKYTYLDSVKIALEGGCKWVQLRIKDATDAEVLPIAVEAQKLCREAGATFIIDDRVELVKQIGADGVHLGLGDMPIAEARKILGEKFIIGGTANTFENVKTHYQASANYVGCGPFRFTTTKKKLSPVLGLEGYRNIVSKMREENINIPIVAIGGITAADIAPIMQTGVTGIALSGTVLRAADPVAEMRRIIELMENGKLKIES